MNDEGPTRYVVVVWLAGHWSVNVASDDRDWAAEVMAKASELPAFMVDVQEKTVTLGGPAPKLIEAVSVQDQETDFAVRLRAAMTSAAGEGHRPTIVHEGDPDAGTLIIPKGLT